MGRKLEARTDYGGGRTGKKNFPTRRTLMPGTKKKLKNKQREEKKEGGGKRQQVLKSKWSSWIERRRQEQKKKTKRRAWLKNQEEEGSGVKGGRVEKRRTHAPQRTPNFGAWGLQH